MGRRLGFGLVVVLLLAGTVVAVFWALQRQLIYFPDATPVPPAEAVIEGARDVRLRTADRLELDAWFVPASGDRDATMAVLVAPATAATERDERGWRRS